MRRVLVILVAATMLANLGCSVLFMERLPDRYKPEETPYCTATKGFVAWDGAIVVGNAVSAGLAASLLDGAEGEERDVYGALASLSAIAAVIHLISALHGNSWANGCQEARIAHERSGR